MDLVASFSRLHSDARHAASLSNEDAQDIAEVRPNPNRRDSHATRRACALVALAFHRVCCPPPQMWKFFDPTKAGLISNRTAQMMLHAVRTCVLVVLEHTHTHTHTHAAHVQWYLLRLNAIDWASS
jgi:hypothetical protein